VASSADGAKLVAVSIRIGASGGLIYTSSDSGATWTQTTAPRQDWQQVASSSDGTKLVAVSSNLVATGHAFGGYIYTSSDSGATWTPRK
jgi:hypothetical protein